ncbi:unnamed protein product [Owenia fusiformis]|uniref:Protein chico n=1 Tax=Owenia fusiformis TaxID=6347 RepID=A0A8S4PK38_OWEFU|nr:unnamed protein product [Owenia fusiformis]
MADVHLLIEGPLKYRDGRKWKSRWCIIRKLSPVADQLLVTLYKDLNEYHKNGSKKVTLTIENVNAIESGFNYDKEQHILAIICPGQISMLALPSRELMIKWEIKIRENLHEDKQFPAKLQQSPNKSKFPTGQVRLHIQGPRISLVAYIPPKLLASWDVTQLRRFGLIDDKFCFEAGSRCGKYAGVFVFKTDLHVEIDEALREASRTRVTTSSRRLLLKRKSHGSLNSLAKLVLQLPDNQSYSQPQQNPADRHSQSERADSRPTRDPRDKRLVSIENIGPGRGHSNMVTDGSSQSSYSYELQMEDSLDSILDQKRLFSTPKRHSLDEYYLMPGGVSGLSSISSVTSSISSVTPSISNVPHSVSNVTDRKDLQITAQSRPRLQHSQSLIQCCQSSSEIVNPFVGNNKVSEKPKSSSNQFQASVDNRQARQQQVGYELSEITPVNTSEPSVNNNQAPPSENDFALLDEILEACSQYEAQVSKDADNNNMNNTKTSSQAPLGSPCNSPMNKSHQQSTNDNDTYGKDAFIQTTNDNTHKDDIYASTAKISNEMEKDSAIDQVNLSESNSVDTSLSKGSSYSLNLSQYGSNLSINSKIKMHEQNKNIAPTGALKYVDLSKYDGARRTYSSWNSSNTIWNFQPIPGSQMSSMSLPRHTPASVEPPISPRNLYDDIRGADKVEYATVVQTHTLPCKGKTASRISKAKLKKSFRRYVNIPDSPKESHKGLVPPPKRHRYVNIPGPDSPLILEKKRKHKYVNIPNIENEDPLHHRRSSLGSMSISSDSSFDTVTGSVKGTATLKSLIEFRNNQGDLISSSETNSLNEQSNSECSSYITMEPTADPNYMMMDSSTLPPSSPNYIVMESSDTPCSPNYIAMEPTNNTPCSPNYFAMEPTNNSPCSPNYIAMEPTNNTPCSPNYFAMEPTNNSPCSPNYIAMEPTNNTPCSPNYIAMDPTNDTPCSPNYIAMEPTNKHPCSPNYIAMDPPSNQAINANAKEDNYIPMKPSSHDDALISSQQGDMVDNSTKADYIMMGKDNFQQRPVMNNTCLSNTSNGPSNVNNTRNEHSQEAIYNNLHEYCEVDLDSSQTKTKKNESNKKLASRKSPPTPPRNIRSAPPTPPRSAPPTPPRLHKTNSCKNLPTRTMPPAHSATKREGLAMNSLNRALSLSILNKSSMGQIKARSGSVSFPVKASNSPLIEKNSQAAVQSLFDFSKVLDRDMQYMEMNAVGDGNAKSSSDDDNASAISNKSKAANARGKSTVASKDVETHLRGLMGPYEQSSNIDMDEEDEPHLELVTLPPKPAKSNTQGNIPRRQSDSSFSARYNRSSPPTLPEPRGSRPVAQDNPSQEFERRVKPRQAPFDNLISYTPRSEHRPPPTPPRPLLLSDLLLSAKIEEDNRNNDTSRGGDTTPTQKTKDGASSSFFSRLIRRNSKSSRKGSQENILDGVAFDKKSRRASAPQAFKPLSLKRVSKSNDNIVDESDPDSPYCTMPRKSKSNSPVETYANNSDASLTSSREDILSPIGARPVKHLKSVLSSPNFYPPREEENRMRSSSLNDQTTSLSESMDAVAGSYARLRFPDKPVNMMISEQPNYMMMEYGSDLSSPSPPQNRRGQSHLGEHQVGAIVAQTLTIDINKQSDVAANNEHVVTQQGDKCNDKVMVGDMRRPMKSSKPPISRSSSLNRPLPPIPMSPVLPADEERGEKMLHHRPLPPLPTDIPSDDDDSVDMPPPVPPRPPIIPAKPRHLNIKSVVTSTGNSVTQTLKMTLASPGVPTRHDAPERPDRPKPFVLQAPPRPSKKSKPKSSACDTMAGEEDHIWVQASESSHTPKTPRTPQTPGLHTLSGSSHDVEEHTPPPRNVYSHHMDMSADSPASYISNNTEEKQSLAQTTLRPRFGKDYQKVERSVYKNRGESHSKYSPHSPCDSVFSFDLPQPSSPSSMSFVSSLSNQTTGESPRSPCLQYPRTEPTYVNMAFNSGKAESPMSLYMNTDFSPPHTPRTPSYMSTSPALSEISNPLLNYAEIDLTQSSSSTKKVIRKPAPRNDSIEYTLIDLVATAAATKVGKEHAQEREDTLNSLKHKDRKGSSQSPSLLSVKERKGSSSSSLSLKERKGSSSSRQSNSSRSGSKDRKPSLSLLGSS